jgi:hypothetical protein
VARRRLTSTIGSVASVWRDPNAKVEEPADPDPVRVTCSLCHGFSMVGFVEPVREAYLTHMAEVHPDVELNAARARRKPDTRRA